MSSGLAVVIGVEMQRHDMRLIILAISMFALTVTPAGAQSSIGVAGTSCAQFLGARSNDALHRQVSNWLYGYASGLSAGLRATQSAASLNLTNDQLLRSATDYCQANPGATIANAASAWVPQPAEAEAAPPRRGFYLDFSKPVAKPGGRQ